MGQLSKPDLEKEIVNKMIDTNKLLLTKIKGTYQTIDLFDFPSAITTKLNRMIKPLNSNEGTGPDDITVKLNQTVNIINPHLASIIIKDLAEDKLSEAVKATWFRLIYKGDDKDRFNYYWQSKSINKLIKNLLEIFTWYTINVLR